MNSEIAPTLSTMNTPSERSGDALSPRPPLRAVVVNCSSDDNKGASAISWGLVNRLRRSGLVGHVTLVTKTGPPDDTRYRHTLERFGNDVPLLPSPLPTRGPQGGRSIRNVAPLVGPTIGAYWAAYRRSLAQREPAAAAISKSDIVFNRGGPFFSVPGGHFHVGIRLAWPFIFAKQEGVPYALVGEGVGPFANMWAKKFHRWLFEGAALIGVREELSRQRLGEIGVPDAQIHTMLDNAFWIEPRASSRVERIIESLRLVENRFLAVTVRAWPGAESEYLPELAKTIDALVPAFLDQAVLVTNVYIPGKPQVGDRRLTRLLQDLLRHNERVHLVDEDLTPEELAAFYGLSAVTLGTRLHSTILALVGGAPVVPISYLPKTNGVMSLLRLDQFVLDMGEYRHEEGVELVRRAVTEQSHVRDLLTRLRMQGDEQLDAFLRGLQSERVRDRTVAT